MLKMLKIPKEKIFTLFHITIYFKSLVRYLRPTLYSTLKNDRSNYKTRTLTDKFTSWSLLQLTYNLMRLLILISRQLFLPFLEKKSAKTAWVERFLRQKFCYYSIPCNQKIVVL